MAYSSKLPARYRHCYSCGLTTHRDIGSGATIATKGMKVLLNQPLEKILTRGTTVDNASTYWATAPAAAEAEMII